MNKLAQQQVANQKFFDDNLDAWLQDDSYKGKAVLISNRQIQGVYNQPRDAYDYAMQNFQPGEFIIQEVISKKEAIGYLKSGFIMRGRHN